MCRRRSLPIPLSLSLSHTHTHTHTHSHSLSPPTLQCHMIQVLQLLMVLSHILLVWSMLLVPCPHLQTVCQSLVMINRTLPQKTARKKRKGVQHSLGIRLKNLRRHSPQHSTWQLPRGQDWPRDLDYRRVRSKSGSRTGAQSADVRAGSHQNQPQAQMQENRNSIIIMHGPKPTSSMLLTTLL